MSALVKLFCVCVDRGINPRFVVVTTAFLAGLCLGQVSHHCYLFAPAGVEISERSWPCPCPVAQCWKVSRGRQLFKEWFQSCLRIPLGLDVGGGHSKDRAAGSAYSACSSVSPQQILAAFLEFASGIATTSVCCKCSSLLLFHPWSVC